MIKIDGSKLKKPLAEGGEAFIYDIGGRVIKVFKDAGMKEQKITEMMRYSFPDSVVAPEELVYSTSGKFLGYAMKKVQGEEVKMLSKKKFCEVNNISTRQILAILMKIKEVLKSIHAKGIYVGDLNDSNILFDNDNVYFIDVDSWDIPGFPCVVAMDGFKDVSMANNKFTAETDDFAFAIMAFKTLTRIHPYGGTYGKYDDLNKRMEEKLSIIGNEKVITIPKNCLPYKYIGTSLVADFDSIFNKGQRFLLDANLVEFSKNNRACPVDKISFHGNYLTCPICDADAQYKTLPTNVGKEVAPHLVLIWYDAIKIIVSPDVCVDGNNAYNINNLLSVPFTKYTHYHPYMNTLLAVTDTAIKFTVDGKDVTIQKFMKTPVSVVGKNIYFVNDACKLCRATYIGVPFSPMAISEIFDVSARCKFDFVSDTEFCIINEYDNCKIINVNGFNTKIDSLCAIDDYGIHYDATRKEFLVAWRTSAYDVDVYVLNKNTIVYNANMRIKCSLGNVAISGGTIFAPDDNNIRAFSHLKNTYKDFTCDGINGDANLVKKDSYIYIYMQDKILRMG